MRAAAAGLLLLLAADVSPKGGGFRETRWKGGDFVAAANEPLDRVVEGGETVGLKISGLGESCLLRKRIYPMRLPCRFAFRVRWTDKKFQDAFPSVHVVLDPPEIHSEWWEAPITDHVGRWRDGVRNFLVHFSTNPDWRYAGLSTDLETSDRKHEFSPPKGEW